MIFVLCVCWLTLVAWLIYRAFRQRELLQVLEPNGITDPNSRNDRPSVVVIIPARDEASNIGPCLEGLLRQHYPKLRLHIVVVDDHSTDTTAAVVRETLRQRLDRAPHVTLLASPALPPGWIGKSHACWIGAQTVNVGVDWLCFLDADVRAEPALLSCAVEAATARKLDLLSLAPRQELGSFAERLIMPCGFFLLAFSQNLRRKQAGQRTEEVTATGQCMLVRHTSYRLIGGHAAIRDQICEDFALARMLKRGGFAVRLFGGQHLLSTRMYSGWTTLWPGLAKNLVETFGGPAPALLTALAAVLFAWCAILVPAAAINEWAQGTASASVATGLASLASLAAFAFHICGVRYFRVPFWYGLLFPLGYTIGALIALDSLRCKLLGRVSWKGRTYPPPDRARAAQVSSAARATSFPRRRSSVP